MERFVDWELAGRIAARGAGAGAAGMNGMDLGEIGARAEHAVLTYTGLVPEDPIPAPEWVTRSEWAGMNLSAMRELIEPVESRIASSIPSAGGDAMAVVAGRIVAAEIGLVLGLASKRVLGQYEFSMAGVDRPARLVFVGVNVEEAVTKLGAARGDVLEWIALHEGTHAAHFAAAPWLREHLGGLTSKLLADVSVQVSPAELLGRLRRAASSDPRQTLAGLRGSDPMTLIAPQAARTTIAEVQAAMAAIEGFAEHVMDAAGGELGDSVPRMRAGIEQRRQARSPLIRLASWLLGFEMKMRQYREGKRFVDEVVRLGGIDGINRAWAGPASLPSIAELADPDGWLARVAPVPTVA